MDTPPGPPTRRALAADRLAERRRHVRRIRMRVAGLSLAALVATSGAVLVQLVTGHDPALARDAAAHTTAAAGSSSHVASAASTAHRTASTAHRSASSGHAAASSSAGHTSAGHTSAGHTSASSARVRPSAVTTSAS